MSRAVLSKPRSRRPTAPERALFVQRPSRTNHAPPATFGELWIVDYRKRIVQAYSAIDQCITLTEDDILDGGSVLPGFSLSIRDWFDSVA